MSTGRAGPLPLAFSRAPSDRNWQIESLSRKKEDMVEAGNIDENHRQKLKNSRDAREVTDRDQTILMIRRTSDKRSAFKEARTPSEHGPTESTPDGAFRAAQRF
jgi:hypothetical protein